MNDPIAQQGLGQTFGPVMVPALNVTKNSWTPVYPDKLWPVATTFIIAAMPAFFAPVAPVVASFNPATIAGELVVAPAQIERRIPSQALRMSGRTPAPVGQVYGWYPEYPAWIERRDPFPQGIFVKPVEAPDVTRFSWRPSYPDWFPERRATEFPQPRFDPLPRPPTAGRAYYPDTAPAGSLPNLGWYTRPLREPDDIARLGWRGQYPAQIDRYTAFPQGWYSKPVEAPDVTRFQWRGSYIDWLPERRALQPQYPVLDAFPRPDQLQIYGWAAYFPDWLPPRRAQDGGWYSKPVQNPQLVPLSWSPQYPDRALRRELVPEGWYALGYPVAPAAPTFFGALYPDQIHHRPTTQPASAVLGPFPQVSFGWWAGAPPNPTLRLHVEPGLIVRPTIEPPDIARYAWRPHYPVWIEWRLPNVGPTLALDPFPRPPAAPTYGAIAIYPIWLPPALLVPTGLFVSIIEPIIPPPITVIGVEAHSGLGQKKPYSVTGELGGGGW